MEFTLIPKTVGCRTGRDAGRPGPDADCRHVRSTSGTLQRDGLPGAEAPADDPLEGKAEVLGEQGIDHGVHGRVAVAQPEEHREEQRIHAVLAEWPDDVHGEKGAPAEDEHPYDDGQRLGRLGLHAESLHLGLDVPPAHLLVGRTRVSRSASLAGVALPPGQLRQTLAHLQVTGAGSSVLLLLPVEL